MRPLLKIFFTGLLISFLGSLPLATMNVAAMQISISETVGHAMLFSLGSLTVEMIYVRISLVALNWIRRQKKLFKVLEYVTLVIVLALAASSFYAAAHPGTQKNIVLSSQLPKFFLGALMCAVSPGQIPFWLGWSTVLFTKKILHPRNDHYNAYIAGIGIGTFIGNCIFIFGGLLIATKINANQHILHLVIGFIFLGTAIFQVWLMLRKKDAVQRIDHPDTETLPMQKEIEKLTGQAET
jgi:threonine/homoserine/homoserine lactone efflux protein